jgi:hypothetical protein
MAPVRLKYLDRTAVGRKYAIGRHQAQWFRERLGQQQPIKGISVM